VRGPKHSIKKGKTSVLNVDETSELLNVIAPDTLMGLRDRALIALMVFTFAPGGGRRQNAHGRLLHSRAQRLGAAAREGQQDEFPTLPPPA
jgi:hypothetical protein